MVTFEQLVESGASRFLAQADLRQVSALTQAHLSFIPLLEYGSCSSSCVAGECEHRGEGDTQQIGNH